MGNDHLLLARLRAGDRQALHLIYEQYRDRLLAVSVTLMPDAHVAEDIVQDVFISFSLNAHRLRLRGSLFQYLRAGIRNAVRDILRRRGRRRRHREFPVAEAVVESPEQVATESEARRALHRCLRHLPTDQRDVVLWRAYQDMPFEEIANRQGICASTARGRYRYGIGKLQDLMCDSA